ncbi:MAG: hypothetical protein PHP98_04025 [Kiritimatiellae bacterium]|nr:hypothetical protein [Kiritimatiellia bacterium]
MLHFIKRVLVLYVALLWSGVFVLQAADRYVVEPGTIAVGHGGVYTDWSIAATQIQWAVDVADTANDTVWVSNGVYVLTNQIEITNTFVINLRSPNGPDVTIVNGGYMPGTPEATTNNRCLFVTNAPSFVHGFTFSNGASLGYGGGVQLRSGIVSNCIVCNNKVFVPSGVSEAGGGGIYLRDGGTVTACRVNGNTVTNLSTGVAGAGGGIYAKGGGCFISDCIVSNNRIFTQGESFGGGVFVYSCKMISYNTRRVTYGALYMRPNAVTYAVCVDNTLPALFIPTERGERTTCLTLPESMPTISNIRASGPTPALPGRGSL